MVIPDRVKIRFNSLLLLLSCSFAKKAWCWPWLHNEIHVIIYMSVPLHPTKFNKIHWDGHNTGLQWHVCYFTREHNSALSFLGESDGPPSSALYLWNYHLCACTNTRLRFCRMAWCDWQTSHHNYLQRFFGTCPLWVTLVWDGNRTVKTWIGDGWIN